jgi:ABC-type branched-subunit amino acid transport system substrate-binding protein
MQKWKFRDRRRQTGRTTRMLAEAVKLAKKGKAVYIVVADMAQKRQMEKQFGKAFWGLGIKFETPYSPGNFDWETMTFRGAHPDCVTLVDHYAIEARFPRLVEMLHRYG